MRIAMLSWESMHSIAVGGIAAHVSGLAAALARQGHKVHVFTRRGSEQPMHARMDGVHYHRCDYEPGDGLLDDVDRMNDAFLQRIWYVEQFTGFFDVVHGHDWLTATALAGLGEADRQRVMTIHSTEFGRCGNTFPDGMAHEVRMRERMGVEAADRVIAVSETTRKEVAWMYEVPAEKSAAVFNGLDVGGFQLEGIDPGTVKRRYSLGPTDPTVLFCGRLMHQKGPDLLVEAIPSVLRYYPQARFIFAGDGGMRGELERRVRELGIAHAVRLLGYRSGMELRELFHAAQVVCVPSRNEPFGIVVLEAWAAGKPVVTTQVGGPAEYVTHEHDGLKIYPNADSIAWGLGTIFKDFDRLRQMGRRGRQTLQEGFSWDAVAERTVEAYALGSQAPRATIPGAAIWAGESAGASAAMAAASERRRVPLLSA